MVVEQQRLGTEVFQALFDRCSNWGRWGADDERGTLNLITAEVRVRAARLVREGVSVSCAHPINTVGDAENSSRRRTNSRELPRPPPSRAEYTSTRPSGEMAKSPLSAWSGGG